MKFFDYTICWIISVIFLLMGVGNYNLSVSAAACLILASIVVNPSAKSILLKRFDWEITTKMTAVSIACLFVLSGIAVKYAEDDRSLMLAQKKIEKEELLIKENRQKFEASKPSIIKGIENLIRDGEFTKAQNECLKYINFNEQDDRDLKKLYSEINKKIAEQGKKKKEQLILAELKKIPVSQFKENRDLYQELNKLYPNNKLYSKKLNFYNTAIERQILIERQFSPWDGSNYSLERFIKNSMNDPDSFQHVNTVYWDKGTYLIVETTYRGKNAFGGLVKNFVKAKIDLRGNVTQILDHT